LQPLSHPSLWGEFTFLKMSVDLSVTELAIVGKQMEEPLDLTLFSIFNNIY
jgi:hypothetical protein